MWYSREHGLVLITIGWLCFGVLLGGFEFLWWWLFRLVFGFGI